MTLLLAIGLTLSSPIEGSVRVDSLPRLVHREPYVVSKEVLSKCEKRVLVMARVDTAGNVDSVRVEPSRSFDLKLCRDSSLAAKVDTACMKAARKWRFKPAKVGQKSVSVWIAIPFAVAPETPRPTAPEIPKASKERKR